MSGPIFLTRNGEETSFARPLKRAVLRDKRLSFGARGLFCMLWDFPTNWTFYASHIVLFSPSGITQLRGYIHELKSCGALDIRVKKINATEAVSLSASSGKTYKTGQIIGKQWVLNHPDLWAIEAPLSEKPTDRFSELRLGKDTEKPKHENSETKDVKNKGVINSKGQLQTVQTEAEAQKPKYSLPTLLNHKERQVAESLLKDIDDLTAHQILTVWNEKLQKNKVRGAPLSYLRGLVERANNGQFFTNPRVDELYKSKASQVKTGKTPPNIRAKQEAAAIEGHINKIFKTIGKSRNFNKSNLT